MESIFKRILSFIVTFIAFFLLSFNVWAANSDEDNSKQLKIYYIDVGHGDCILIQTPNEKTILVDSESILSKKTVHYYLEDQCVSKIDVLICTHPHPDHIGNMDWIIKNYDIGSIYMPKVTISSSARGKDYGCLCREGQIPGVLILQTKEWNETKSAYKSDSQNEIKDKRILG